MLNFRKLYIEFRFSIPHVSASINARSVKNKDINWSIMKRSEYQTPGLDIIDFPLIILNRAEKLRNMTVR